MPRFVLSAALATVAGLLSPAGAVTAEDFEFLGLTCGFTFVQSFGTTSGNLVGVVSGGPVWVTDFFDRNTITTNPAPGTNVRMTCTLQTGPTPGTGVVKAVLSSGPTTAVVQVPPTVMSITLARTENLWVCTTVTWNYADGRPGSYVEDVDSATPGVQCN